MLTVELIQLGSNFRSISLWSIALHINAVIVSYISFNGCCVEMQSHE